VQITLKRVPSIDAFRALTMLLMIFVNDFWSLSGIPYWLEHAKAEEDFLGFSDIIFPCFLFILGMAIPFALQNRIAKGDTRWQIITHIVLRSVALITMGIFTVNIPELNAQATGMRTEWFQILMVIGFFLIWNVYPKKEAPQKYLFLGLQGLGVALLAYLAFIFRGGEADVLTGMRSQWWGILGLIGWTYLVCALIYLFFYKNATWLMVAGALFTFFTIAGHAGWLKAIWPSGPGDWILGNGAFHAFAMTGLLATLLMEWLYQKNKRTHVPSIFTSIGVSLVLIGLLLRNFFIISKIQATPTWVFLCSGIAFMLFAAIYFWVDLRGKAKWFNPIKVAGTATLTCYLIPYVYYSVANLLPFALPEVLKFGLIGLVKSLIYAFIVIGITAVLGKFNIKLKI
jgi:heparan-alpha-glucosaminide N-acetyltransferase